MKSEAKSRAARENGAKSRGPVTPEGKAKSSRNAVKHGLATRDLVLANENPAAFNELAAEYYEKFKPADTVERDLVNDMVFARWRLRRVWVAETALIDNEMNRQGPQIEEEYRTMDEPTRTALAMRELADSSKSLSSFIRYEMRYRRSYSRALKELLLLRSACAGENQKVQNEPKPGPPPAPAAPGEPPEPAPPPEPGPPESEPNAPAGPILLITSEEHLEEPLPENRGTACPQDAASPEVSQSARRERWEAFAGPGVRRGPWSCPTLRQPPGRQTPFSF